MGEPLPFRILVLSGPDGGCEFPSAGAEIVIGRDSACTAPLKDPAVSRRHARIRRSPSGLFHVEDLRSRNGTFMDGVAVQSAEGEAGLILRVGSSEFTLLDDSPSHALGSDPAPDTTRFLPEGVADGAPSLRDRSRRDLELFVTAMEAMGGSSSPRALAKALVSPVLAAFGAASAALWKREGLHRLRLLAEAEEGARKATDGRSPWPMALLREVLERGRAARALTERAWMVCPLVSENRSLAVFALEKAGDREWSDDDLSCFEWIGRLAGPVLDARELHARLGRDRAQLLAVLREDCDLIGTSPAMRGLQETLVRLACAPTAVLLRGESGTGKELAARALHFNGPRAGGPFVAVNCAALAPGLVEAELFGHERGAFTGAEARRRGKIELAQGGSLFLDEVGDLPPEAQASLLRVLETRRMHRVGGTEELEVDLRLLAATHRDLEEELRHGRFREDLFYRLSVVRLDLPPLRERLDDLEELLAHFCRRCARELGRTDRPHFDEEALRRMRCHSWPGNVRELRNVVERALVLWDDEVLGPQTLPPALGGADPAAPASGDDETELLSLRELEEGHVRKVLAHCAGNKSRAAEILGIERATLYAKIARYGL